MSVKPSHFNVGGNYPGGIVLLERPGEKCPGGIGRGELTEVNCPGGELSGTYQIFTSDYMHKQKYKHVNIEACEKS